MVKEKRGDGVMLLMAGAGRQAGKVTDELAINDFFNDAGEDVDR